MGLSRQCACSPPSMGCPSSTAGPLWACFHFCLFRAEDRDPKQTNYPSPGSLGTASSIHSTQAPRVCSTPDSGGHVSWRASPLRTIQDESWRTERIQELCIINSREYQSYCLPPLHSNEKVMNTLTVSQTLQWLTSIPPFMNIGYYFHIFHVSSINNS